MKYKTNNIQKNILIIGPMAAGKTTTSIELHKQLRDLVPIHIDTLKKTYFDTTDYSFEVEEAIKERSGFIGVNNYRKPYELALALDVLSKVDTPSIIDLGAAQTVYDDPEMLKTIQQALASQENIFLILPCKDIEKSKKILEKRLEHREYKHRRRERKIPLLSRLTRRLKVDDSVFELNANFMDSDSNLKLASHIVYTNGATPKEVAEAIAATYNNRPLTRGRVEIVRNPQRVKLNKFHTSLKSETSNLKDEPISNKFIPREIFSEDIVPPNRG